MDKSSFPGRDHASISHCWLTGEPGRTVNQVDDGFGINVGGGLDFTVMRRVSLGLDMRYHNALTVLGGFDFVTALMDVGIHL